MIGDESVVVHLRLRVFTDDDDFAPIRREGIGAVAQEHIIDKAVGPALPVPAVPVCGDNLTDEIELNPHFALISQKRRRLREKYAKSTQVRIAHRVQLVVAPLAHVRKLLRIPSQPGHELLEHGPPPTFDLSSRLWCTRSHTHNRCANFKLRTAEVHGRILT